MNSSLQRLTVAKLLTLNRGPVDPATFRSAADIVTTVRSGGVNAMLNYAYHFGELQPDSAWLLPQNELEKAAREIPVRQLELLRRVAERIQAFAEAQLMCIRELSADISSGKAGHIILPMKRVGCYAPGGRYPLPSSVLMTVIPARVAGVRNIVVASPKPPKIVLAAAALAGAHSLLCVGGAQAIAALAYGVDGLEPCDMIVGPGNRWVTAAKLLVAGQVAIDLPGGPSELVVIADESANPRLIAADLLAQAEHDVDALPIVISTSESLLDEVDSELNKQLGSLPTSETAAVAISRGCSLLVRDMEEAADVSNRIAPEHLQLLVRPEAEETLQRCCTDYGALFRGEQSAEVIGDYGAGPNHVLPTGGSAHSFSGLSVFNFLRFPTWMWLSRTAEYWNVVQDTIDFARIEGLEAHARAAELRTAALKSS